MADLRGGERHGDIGAKTKFRRVAGVGRKTGGNVHRDPAGVLEPTHVIEIGDHPGDETAERPGTARAEDGVHDDAGPGPREPLGPRLAERPLPGGLVGAGQHVEGEALRRVVVRPGLPGEALGVGEQHRTRAEPARRERAERHESIPSVAPPSAEDQDPVAGGRRLGGDDLGDGPPGVLHQHPGRNPGRFDGLAVRLPHLPGGENVHEPGL